MQPSRGPIARLEWLREWILEKFDIVASIELPDTTFEPATGTSTGILVVKKSLEQREEIFMSIAKRVGHDSRGELLYQTKPNGEVEAYSGEPILDDDLPAIAEEYREWIENQGIL